VVGQIEHGERAGHILGPPELPTVAHGIAADSVADFCFGPQTTFDNQLPMMPDMASSFLRGVPVVSASSQRYDVLFRNDTTSRYEIMRRDTNPKHVRK